MTLTKQSPSVFRDVETTWDNFFKDDFFSHFGNGKKVPAVNVKEDASQFTIELAAPGKEKKDFDIKIENGVLTISSEEKKENLSEGKEYTRKEFSYSSFSRSFSLPESADDEKMDAKYENGVLLINIAKKAAGQSGAARRIQVL